MYKFFINIFKNNKILWFIKYYNLIILILFNIGCFIYLFDNELFKKIYILLVSILGFNLSGLIYNGYVLSRLKFCKWQVIAYMSNVIINILWLFLKILSNFYKFKYDLIIITTVSCIFLIYTIRFLINGRKNFNVFEKRR